MADVFYDSDLSEVDANQVLPENVIAVALWCEGVAVTEHDAFNHEETYAGINVPTADGMKRAQENDWIVKDALGGFHVFTDNKFCQMFSPK